VEQSRAKNANSTLASLETHRIEIAAWQHKHIGTHWIPKSHWLGAINSFEKLADFSVGWIFR
jgi:hypothetical protein